ncbi:hypothetical protein PENANT_c006G11425 [Penicillium antarcticum]|uniref:Uncharacterized protein n=1 Tax=Penicillium antarcticum TaxID=416450 RepID=A0A1V6QEH9_9EURO|nr:hypothetical protein PENANT_c006G11425 [Penicillium antarcticum]
MLIYLESLAHRMGNVSETPMPSSKHPDFFCMFKAVLEIMISTYVPPSSGSRDSDIAPGDFHVTQELSREPQDPEPETWTPGSNASRCPVLNGTLQDTDFWRALEQNDPVTEENVGGTTADLQGDGFGQRNEATTSDPWLEWPSILSDWVLDPDHVPT